MVRWSKKWESTSHFKAWTAEDCEDKEFHGKSETKFMHQQKRKSAFAGWIRNRFPRNKCRCIMFSDEKWFDSDGQVNRQNDRVYAQSRQAATDAGGIQPEKKYPLKVMVWVGLTWNGPTEPVFLPAKTSFNHHFYRNQVLPIVKRDGLNLIGKYFWFQQDGASPHTCPATLDVIEKLNVLHISPELGHQIRRTWIHLIFFLERSWETDAEEWICKPRRFGQKYQRINQRSTTENDTWFYW